MKSPPRPITSQSAIVNLQILCLQITLRLQSTLVPALKSADISLWSSEHENILIDKLDQGKLNPEEKSHRPPYISMESPLLLQRQNGYIYTTFWEWLTENSHLCKNIQAFIC